VINSKHWSLLHEQNVKEPYHFTMCGFQMMQISVWTERQTKMCTFGLLKVHTFIEKMHHAAKITVWSALSSLWTIKPLFLKKSVKS